MCLNQLRAVNTQVNSALTIQDGIILNSFVEFKVKRPESQDMVAVMDYTYELAKQGPMDTMG